MNTDKLKKNSMKKAIKRRRYAIFVRLLLAISKWQCSDYFLLRSVGTILSLPLFIFFKSKYFHLLMYLQKINQEHIVNKQKHASIFLPEKFFAKVIFAT